MFNPKRLEFARRRRGITKKNLAEAVGLTPRSITYYESGEREPEADTELQLSRVLRFPVDFFHGDDLEELSGDGASFRALSRMTAAQRDAALAAGALALRLAQWIEERFDLPRSDVPDAHENADPEGAANEVRTAWGLGSRPIKNLIHTLEARGVRVFSLAEDHHEVDAFSVWRGRTPFIFLNTRKSAERSRFDAAHELGHLVLHRHGVPRGRQAEDDANAFASALLMPKESMIGCSAVDPSLRGIIEGKQTWGVSAMAYSYRLYKIGMISDWHYHQLMRKMSARGYRTQEPAPKSRETSQLLWKVFDQLRAGGVTKAEVARDLDIVPEELEQLIFGLVLTGIRGRGIGSGEEAPTNHLRLVR